MGDRLPDPARAAVRLLDGAAAGARRRARRQPRRSSATNRSGASGCWLARARDLRERLARAGVAGAGRRVRRSSRSSIGDNERAVAVARALQARGLRRPRHPAADRAGRARRASASRSTPGCPRRRIDRFVGVARGRAQGGRALLRGLFVTGTDTGVGKTVVVARRCCTAIATPAPVRYWKPIQTGIEQDDDTADGRAAGRLRPERGARRRASGCRVRCRRTWPRG